MNLNSLVGTRAVLKRLTDGAMVRGWVSRFQETSFSLETDSAEAIEPGDTFECSLATSKNSVSFVAIAQAEPETLSMTALGGAVTSATSHLWLLNFQVMGELRFAQSSEPVRMRHGEVQVTVHEGDAPIESTLVDIAPGGVGVLLGREFAKDATLSVTLLTRARTFEVGARVAYCKPEPGAEGSFRIGLHFETMHRLDAAAWKRIFQ